MGKLISPERLKLMTARQQKPAWGADYQPAIRATPQEAPRISRPTILQADKLGPRGMHLLSLPEASAAYLALYHPLVFDVHEQRLLSTTPAPHPLDGSRAGMGNAFKPVRGTVLVAEELGVLAKHPKLYLSLENSEVHCVPFPYVGDLLLFIEGADGPYCINWTIKLEESDFLRRGPRPLGRVVRRGLDPGAEIRHLIEAKYYEDAGISTIRVTQTQIDVHLVANLRVVFTYHKRTTSVLVDVQQAAFELFQEAVGSSEIAYTATQRIALELGIAYEQSKVLLHQGIWNRKISVDLFTPFLMSRPLKPMRQDPIDVYKNWFEG